MSAAEEASWSPDPQLRVLAFRTPTLPPATHTNSVLVGEGELILVEPGPRDEDELARMVAWVERARAAGERVIACVPTHHHVDHVGALSAVVSRLGLPIWAHAETACRLPDGVPVARTLTDYETLRVGAASISIVHTPGHAPGHICLDLPERGFTLVGDMVASVGTILIEPTDGDMGAYLASLSRLADLGARALVPAHGGLIPDGPALYNHYVTHRLAREAEVLEALRRKSPRTALALVPEVYRDVPPAVWPLAVLSLAAHLVHLEKQGEVTRLGAQEDDAGDGLLDADWVARDKRA